MGSDLHMLVEVRAQKGDPWEVAYPPHIARSTTCARHRETGGHRCYHCGGSAFEPALWLTERWRNLQGAFVCGDELGDVETFPELASSRKEGVPKDLSDLAWAWERACGDFQHAACWYRLEDLLAIQWDRMVLREGVALREEVAAWRARGAQWTDLPLSLCGGTIMRGYRRIQWMEPISREMHALVKLLPALEKLQESWAEVRAIFWIC